MSLKQLGLAEGPNGAITLPTVAFKLAAFRSEAQRSNTEPHGAPQSVRNVTFDLHAQVTRPMTIGRRVKKKKTTHTITYHLADNPNTHYLTRASLLLKHI